MSIGNLRCAGFLGLVLVWWSIQTVAADEGGHALRVQFVGDVTAARVTVLGADGQALVPPGAIQRKTTRGETYFYADGGFECDVPAGHLQLKCAAGLEVVPQTVHVDIAAATDVKIQLRYWSDVTQRGWYSGDSHVHLHTGGPLEVTAADALLAARAEGVNYVNLCVSNNVGDDIRDPELISGVPHEVSTDRHLIVFGEEMRSSIYGHMQFFGIRSLVEPQYTGFDNTPQHLDYPANYKMALEAVAQGGVVTYGHPMFAGQPDPFSQDLTAANAAARELPIDAMLGAVQAVDLMCYNSDETLSAELWYRLLNCGLKLAACAGTDALLDRSTDPLGGDRVYVQVDGPLTMQTWLDGLRAGRTFVTNGPMPAITVQGIGPGGSLELDVPGQVLVQVRVESRVPVDKVELVQNGQVVQSRDVQSATGGDLLVQSYELPLTIERSSWVALRVRGPDHADLMDGPAWAHTSPVYIGVGGQPITSVDDAAYFVEWIDQLLRVVAARDRYPTPADRRQLEATFRTAQDKFRAMAGD